MGQELALARTEPGGEEAGAIPAHGAGISLMPQALVEAAGAMGVELAGKVEQAAELLVAGTLSPRSRDRYGRELGAVAGWCHEHGLGLLALTPLDAAALAVARRRAGQDPRGMLSALSFVYRHKPGGPEDITGLALRVDRVWRAKNRDVCPPISRAAVLPLLCWEQMHAAVGSKGYLDKDNGLQQERIARDKLVISLSVSGGLRPGELGRLSASKGRVDETGRLVLPLVVGTAGSTTKTGRSEIAVPVGVPPFDVFPLVEDFERLRRLRLARAGADDHLVAGAWHHGTSGGLAALMLPRIWRRAAEFAGISGAQRVVGYSARRSMVHIAAAAGWTLEQIAAVTGHVSTAEIERSYLEGYGGEWARSEEGRELLLGSAEGWEDCPANWAPGFARRAGVERRWWQGRDVEADRAEAAALARVSPRVHINAGTETALIGRRWEAFCADNGADPAKPAPALLEMFAIDFTKGITSHRHNSVRYLADHFAALPTTELGRIAEISRWVMDAANLGGRITKDNRRQANTSGKGRAIVPVTDGAMEKIFAHPLVNRHEGGRLVGLVFEQGSAHAALTERARRAFRFGEHARLSEDAAELLAPLPSGGGSPGPGGLRVAVSVARRGGDPNWCGYEAVRRLIAHYPDMSIVARYRSGALTSRCKSLIRWLQARAVIAVLYATGLRPTDLDGFRWPDLRLGADGHVMWRLPYSKGNIVGDRLQVLRLAPSDRPWCPVRALQDLASSIQQARDAGWEEQPAEPDSDGAVRRVFGPRAGRNALRYLMEPSGVDIRPQDFRYRKAAQIWEETLDIQMVRAALFHLSEAVSMTYVARGLPAKVRAEIDPLARLYHNIGDR